MKIRNPVLLVSCILMAQAAFGGPISNCTQGTPIGDGSGGELTSFSCTFYENPSDYPFSLTTFISQGGLYAADEYENWWVPSYMVFTTDPGTPGDTAAWKDALYFVPDEVPDFSTPDGYDGSDEVILYWGASLNSSFFTTVNNFGAANCGNIFVQAGTTYTDPPDLHSFNIGSTLTPEPSTLLLVFTAGLATLAVRRRRRV